MLLAKQASLTIRHSDLSSHRLASTARQQLASTNVACYLPSSSLCLRQCCSPSKPLSQSSTVISPPDRLTSTAHQQLTSPPTPTLLTSANTACYSLSSSLCLRRCHSLSKPLSQSTTVISPPARHASPLPLATPRLCRSPATCLRHLPSNLPLLGTQHCSPSPMPLATCQAARFAFACRLPSKPLSQSTTVISPPARLDFAARLYQRRLLLTKQLTSPLSMPLTKQLVSVEICPISLRSKSPYLFGLFMVDLRDWIWFEKLDCSFVGLVF